MTPRDRRVPRLLAISDRHAMARRDVRGAFGGDFGGDTETDIARQATMLASWLDELKADGVDSLLLREKDLDDSVLLRLADRLVAARSAEDAPKGAAPTRLMVSGRADLALAAGLDGVHLPAAEVPARLLRDRFGDGLLIGRSTHHPDEVATARDDGVDYVTFGPVFDTPSKAIYGPPPGLTGLALAARHGLPVLALGGITAARLPAVAQAGAHGVAAIRSFFGAEQRRALVTAARTLWELPQPAIR